MRKQSLRIILSSILVLLTLAACQAIPGQVASKTPAAVINSQNAARLNSANQVAETGTLNDLVWASDSSALIAISGSGAVRYSA